MGLGEAEKRLCRRLSDSGCDNDLCRRLSDSGCDNDCVVGCRIRETCRRVREQCPECRSAIRDESRVCVGQLFGDVFLKMKTHLQTTVLHMTAPLTFLRVASCPGNLLVSRRLLEFDSGIRCLKKLLSPKFIYASYVREIYLCSIRASVTVAQDLQFTPRNAYQRMFITSEAESHTR